MIEKAANNDYDLCLCSRSTLSNQVKLTFDVIMILCYSRQFNNIYLLYLATYVLILQFAFIINWQSTYAWDITVTPSFISNKEN